MTLPGIDVQWLPEQAQECGVLNMPRKPKSPNPAAGHNSLDKDRLRSLIERIEAIEAERAELASDISDVYSEAKGQGFDVAALRQVVKLRRQDEDERSARQAVIDEYLHALGDLSDLPRGRSAMARAGLMPPV
jgi:uncharacterized protein (UPF0335 family)